MAEDIAFYEFIIIVALLFLVLVPLMVNVFIKDTLGMDIDDLRGYLEERERQKTLRKIVEVQRDREALGVAEERDLLDGHDLEALVHGDSDVEEEPVGRDEEESDTVGTGS